jgi:hypothetical protein
MHMLPSHLHGMSGLYTSLGLLPSQKNANVPTGLLALRITHILWTVASLSIERLVTLLNTILPKWTYGVYTRWVLSCLRMSSWFFFIAIFLIAHVIFLAHISSPQKLVEMTPLPDCWWGVRDKTNFATFRKLNFSAGFTKINFFPCSLPTPSFLLLSFLLF